MTIFQRRQRQSGEPGSQRPRGRRRGPGRGRRLELEALERRLVLTTSTWSGAVDGLWSTLGNWDTPPAAGNDLVFPAGAAHLANTNDLAAGTSFSSLKISGAGYAIAGAAIALAGPLDAAQAAGTDTVSLPIDLGATAAVAVDNNGAVLVLGGVLSGSNGLTKQGPGELDLTADNVYTGTTTINGGTVKVDGAQGGSPVAVNSGTLLEGGGTVSSITVAGGTVSPGGPAPGVLHDTGDATFQGGSTFAVALNGTSAGTTYSQLQAAGQVALGNAGLSATLGYSPADNDQYVIINNTGSSAVSGTFASLPQGATVTIGGQPFQVSYTGGDGNDVVLTHLVGSTTTVAASPASPVVGQTVTLTATVGSAAPGTTTTPTGTVEFFNGSASLGTGTLSGGVATLNTTSLGLGANSVTAHYQGDSTFGPGTSPATPVTVAQAATTTSVSDTPNPSTFGQSVALTATVLASTPGGGVPTGTVQFFNGGTSLGTATLTASGTATLSVTTLPVGADVITAQYQGSANYAGSTSPDLIQTVNQQGTTTALTIVPNPSGLGQTVTLRATVAPLSNSSPTPTGTVEFFNGSTSLGTGTLSGGVATLTTSTLPLGGSSLTAQYQGDTNFTASNSAATTATVAQASTATVTASTSVSTFGQPVTFTATVHAGTGTGTPTGTVTFLNGSTSFGSANLSGGVATLTSPNLPIGSDAITVQYSGDTTFAGSTSPAITVTVGQASTTTTVTAAPNPGGLNQPITLTATVATTGTSTTKPSGTVQFFNGAVSLGTATVANGVATLTTSALTLGANSITALYSGDTNYSGSTSTPFTETLNQASATALSVSPSTSVFGQPVNMTATVSPSTGTGTPTGSVQFFSGTTSLGTATLSGGVATLPTTGLKLGINSVTAKYLGDPTFAGSTSPASSTSVTQASTATTVTVAPNPSGFAQPVTLKATVAAASPGTGTPTGSVQFFSGTTSLGTATLSGGVATLPTTSLAFGNNSVTAQYQGDTDFKTSTSATVTATVNQASSKVTLTVSKPNPVASEAVVLTATVAGSSSTGTPTGTVVFFANNTAIGQGTLTGGVATFTTAKLPVGTVTLKAVYGGDTNFAGATSSPVSLTVGTDVERFLNQVYLDALGRPADQAGLDYWRTQLVIGVPVKQVVQGIVSSPEGQGAVVQAAYHAFLHRPATADEVDAALSPAALASGVGIESRVLGSREYFETQAGGTNESFVTALYLDVLGTSDVPPEAAARLTQQLRDGASRTDVAQELLLSQKGRVALINSLYKRVLGRAADPTGTADLLGLMSRGGRISQALIALLSSEEFRSRYNITS